VLLLAERADIPIAVTLLGIGGIAFAEGRSLRQQR
jgi:hypothetical protein